MNSEKHYCLHFLDNLLSKLEKYRSTYIAYDSCMATVIIEHDEFILQCLEDGTLKVSIAIKRDDSHYYVTTEYIGDWRGMDALGNFIVVLAARYSLKKLKCF